MMCAKKLLICMGVFACMLTGCASSSSPTPKPLTVLEPRARVEWAKEVTVPSLSYSVVLQQMDGTPITEEKPLSLDKGTASFTLSLQCGNYSPQSFGFFVFVGGVPVPCTVDGKKAFCHYFTSGSGVAEKRKITFTPSFRDWDDDVLIVIVEQADTNSRTITWDYTTAIRMPIANPRSVPRTEDTVPNAQSCVYNLREYFRDADSDDLAGDLNDVLLNVKNHALSVSIRGNEDRPLTESEAIFHRVSHPTDCYLEAIGQPGEYITTVFIDDVPYGAFGGSASIRYTLEDAEDFLSAFIALPADRDIGLYSLYALCVPVKMDADHPIVYDSNRRPYYILNQDKLLTDFDRFSVTVESGAGEKTEFMSNTRRKQYWQMENHHLELEYVHQVYQANDARDMSLYVLCNGIPQKITRDGNTSDRIQYAIRPGGTYSCPISVDIDAPAIDGKWFLQIIAFPGMDDGYNAQAAYRVYGTEDKYVIDVIVDAPDTAKDVSETNVYTEIAGKDFPEGEERKFVSQAVIMERDSSVPERMDYTYWAGGYAPGSYVVRAYLDGEPIPLADGREAARITFTNTRQYAAFDISVPNDPMRDQTLIFLSVAVSENASANPEREGAYGRMEWDWIAQKKQAGAPEAGEKWIVFRQIDPDEPVFDQIHYAEFHSPGGQDGYCVMYCDLTTSTYEEVVAVQLASSTNARPLTGAVTVMTNTGNIRGGIVASAAHVYAPIPGGYSVRYYIAEKVLQSRQPNTDWMIWEDYR